MRVGIDPARCFGHGRCYTVAPGLFRDDDAGYGQVERDGTVAPADAEPAHRAVRECPERAVTLTE